MTSKFKLSELKNVIVNTYDLFICSSSFEDRCLSISKNMDLSKISYAMVVYNSDYLEYVEANKDMLKDIFTPKVTCVEIKHSNPIFSADSMRDFMMNHLENHEIKSVLIDITTFTHETLLILLRLLQNFYSHIKITCLYTNAAEYNSENKKDDKWLSKGIGEIRSVLGYSGNILPTQKTHLIIIVGYEFERAASIINALEPSILSLGFGRSDNATTDKDKDANEHYLQLVEQMATSYVNILRFEVRCNDPFATYEELQKHIGNDKDKNILIVPLNNKLSTLGVAFTAMKNEDIQLCYAPALTYNYSNYSVPGDSFYKVDISEMLKLD